MKNLKLAKAWAIGVVTGYELVYKPWPKDLWHIRGDFYAIHMYMSDRGGEADLHPVNGLEVNKDIRYELDIETMSFR